MTHHFQIAPECWADTLLVEMLGFKKPNHKRGIGDVVRAFAKISSKTTFVGIIDDDKLKPKELADFKRIKEKNDLVLSQKPDTRHYLIIICPAFETWVFVNAEMTGTDPAKFNFKHINSFKSATKSEWVSDNQQVKQFLNTLRQKNAPGFVLLQTWLEEILAP